VLPRGYYPRGQLAEGKTITKKRETFFAERLLREANMPGGHNQTQLSCSF